MKPINKSILSCTLALAGISALPLTTHAEFAGYFRSGIGVSDNGDQQCTAVFGVGRLGNECGTYAELEWKKNVYEKDGKTFELNAMLAYFTDQNEDFEVLGDDSNDGSSDGVAARQFNVKAKGLLAFSPETTLWAGKRFYQRHDIHHLDFFYWDTTGPGAGIENINTGLGDVSIALIRSDQDDVNANIFDLRLANINIGGSNTLELGVNYNWRNLTDSEEDANDDADPTNDVSDENSTLLTAELKTPIGKGHNTFVLQYGTEGYSSLLATSGYNGGKVINVDDLGDDATGFRLINHGLVNLSPSIEMAYAGWYASTERDTAGNDIDAYSLSARTAFKWNDTTKTYLELGHQATDYDGEENTLSKVTIAQAWSAGSDFFARPEIRLFASYLTSDNENTGNAVEFADGEDNVFNVGVQAEIWW